jgi:ferredoxin
MLIHGVVGEQSHFRRFLLYVFARYIEVPLLRTCFHLLRGRWSWIGKQKWVRLPAAILLARPFGYLGDTAKPMPYDEVLSLIDALDGPLAVGPCRCRKGHKACPHPLETDIVFRTGFFAWMKAFPKEYREISKQEAKTIVRSTHDLGMFHMVFIHCPVNLYNEYVICNCCTCGCVPYIINRELTQLNYPLIDGYYMAITDRQKCKGCAKCIEVCPFSARTFIDGKSKTAYNCFGCGLCRYACPEQAITMTRLREPLPPRDRDGNPPTHYHPGFYHQHKPYREE